MRSLFVRTLSVCLLLTVGSSDCLGGFPDRITVSRTILRGDDMSDTSLRVSLSTNFPLLGFSFGVLPVGPIDLVEARYIGPPAEFQDVDLLGTGGANFNVVIAFSSPALAIGEYSIADLTLDATALSPGSSSPIEIRDNLGTPPTPIVYDTTFGPVTPTVENGQIERAFLPDTGDLGDFLWIPRGGTNDVAVIDASTGVILGIGTSGAFDPSAVAVNADGTAWVAFESSGQVVPYNIVQDTVSEGVPTVVDGSPVALAIDPEQSLWVASHSPSNLGKIIQGGGVLLGGSGALGPSVPFTGDPIDLACDPIGNVWLTTSSPNTVQKFSPTGTLVFSETFTEPLSGIALDRDGFAWVVAGEFVKRLSSDGAEVGEWNFPTASQLEHIAVRADPTFLGEREAYVTGIQGATLGLFRVQLPPQSTPEFFPTPPLGPFGPLPSLSGLAIDGLGFVRATDPTTGFLYRFDPSAESFTENGSVGIDIGFQGDASGYVQANVLHPGTSGGDPLGDLDGDGSRNATELDIGSSPFDVGSTPATVDPAFVAPIFALTCATAPNGEVAITWENGSTLYSGVSVARVDALGIETILDGNLPPSTTGFVDPNVPDGRFDYRVRAFGPASSAETIECTIIRGSGEVLLRRSVEIGGVVANLFDITTLRQVDPTDPTNIIYYATDENQAQIYALNRDFEVLAIVAPPFGTSVSGIAYDPDGNPGGSLPGSLLVSTGGDDTPITVFEIPRSGNEVLNSWSLTQTTTFQGQVEVRGRPGGLAFSRNTGYILAVGLTGPIGCDVFAFSKGGTGTVDALNSFPHPEVSTVGFTLRGIDIPPGASYGATGGTVALLSPAFLTLNAQEEKYSIGTYSVSAGVPTPISQIPLDAIEDENTIGGFALRGNVAAVVGATTSNLYRIRRAVFDAEFLRGDCNPNTAVDLGDVMALLTYLFAGANAPGCRDACDIDDNGELNLSDIIKMLLYLFNGGPQPPAPFPNCGPDPTEDVFDCVVQCV